MNPSRTWANNRVICGEVGSGAHGTSVAGQDDKDLMGVFVETPEQVFGTETCKHYTWRSRNEGARSGVGDTDFVAYSLRRYCQLAIAGNATVILLMWLPDYLYEFGTTEVGSRLISMRRRFISKESGKRYLGYLKSQKECLLGIKKPKTQRPELVEQYGYDVKFAMHALRLGLQGIELLTTQHLTIPVERPALDHLRAVRTGKYDKQLALQMIEDAERRLKEVVDKCDLEADTQAINLFLIDAHQYHWKDQTTKMRF